jgi:hypothetical protein
MEYQKDEKVSILIDSKWKRGFYVKYDAGKKIHYVDSQRGTFVYRVFDSEIRKGWGKQ